MSAEDEIRDSFSLEQKIRLKSALKLKDDEELELAISVIGGTIMAYHLMVAARNRNPNRQRSKQKLLQIAAAARKLSLLLSDFSVSHSIGNELEALELVPPKVAKIFHRRPLWSDDEVQIKDMFEMLGNIDINARILAKDDRSFSYYYMLPTVQDVNRDFDANTLWPRLFKFWEMAGNKVASTPNGPTFLFLSLIHEVAGINAPELGALRSACERWRTDPTRTRSEDVPWVA